MKSTLKIACFALVTACQCAQAAPDDVVRIVNRLRAPGGACASKAPPLIAQNTLDATAAQLARGASLDSALKSADYRATLVQVITITGEGLRPRLETLLATRYCPQIGNQSLTEVGVYERANKIWLVLAAPFAPKVEMTRQQMAQRMLALVNEARARPRKCGDKRLAAAQPVQWNTLLERAASLHATDMATNNYFSHAGRDGSTFAQRITRAAYRYQMAGENIAAGQMSPEQVVAGWIKSPAHCVNLMNGGYTEMGVAAAADAQSAMGVYWVQLFGRPK